MDFCLDNTDEAHKHSTHSTHNQLLGERDNGNQSLEKMELAVITSGETTPIRQAEIKAGLLMNIVLHVPLNTI